MKTLITNAQVVTHEKVFPSDILIEEGIITRIAPHISTNGERVELIDAKGNFVFPGIIDDQVHFHEPGLTHKATIYTESRAAAAGGVTSFMEMPNTIPNTFTQKLLEEKYQIGAKTSQVNYSFYMGASNDNLDEVLKTDPTNVCGVKIFMGSSTGNLLVDNKETLDGIFSSSSMLIATHCEDEKTVQTNLAHYIHLHGSEEAIPIAMHPIIRSRQACYKSSSFAVELAKKYGTRLHVLHISSREELELFSNKLPLHKKKITAEACLHHMHFNNDDYGRLGTRIKWNPAIKLPEDQIAITMGVKRGVIDVIATDHAPHTREEKQNGYKSPSGAPLVQHSLPLLYKMYEKKIFTLEQIAEKAAYNPAVCFRIKNRGEIKEGNYADLSIFKVGDWKVTEDTIQSKCGWSPLEGETMPGKVIRTLVNGETVFYLNENESFCFPEVRAAQRLTFGIN